MKPEIELVAVLDLANASLKDIAEKFNCSTATIGKLRKSEEYQEYKHFLKESLKEKFIDSYGDLFSKLNQASEGVIDSLISIAAIGEKDADRIKAGVEILDRAPLAPKKIVSQDNQKQIIEFSSTVFDNMKAALLETGNHDTIDLIEHKDFEIQEQKGETEEEIKILDINDL